jgi:hypothetical protein
MGERTALVTLEMSPNQVFKRFYPQFGSPEACRDWITEHDATITHSYLDYQEVERVVRDGYDFVIVDHVHELPFEGHEDLSRKVHRLASLAPETSTTILMLAQLKVPNPDFEDPKPHRYSYAWSKAIPEVSSVCQAIWKPNPDMPDYELLTLKNRFGPENGPVKMKLDRETITFVAK